MAINKNLKGFQDLLPVLEKAAIDAQAKNLPPILMPPVPEHLLGGYAALLPGVDPCEMLFIEVMMHMRKERGYNQCKIIDNRFYRGDPQARMEKINGFIQSGKPLPHDLRVFFDFAIQAGDLHKGFDFKGSKSDSDFHRINTDAQMYGYVNATDLPRHTKPGGAYWQVKETYYKQGGITHKGEPKPVSPNTVAHNCRAHEMRVEEFCNRPDVKHYCQCYEEMREAGELLP